MFFLKKKKQSLRLYMDTAKFITLMKTIKLLRLIKF
jgi:hypothetical protein